jgi:hypothetical protein
MSPNVKLSENPLQQAGRALMRIRKTARLCTMLPIPVIALATAGFFTLDYHLKSHHWYYNPFLVLIYAIFVTGQVLAVSQMRRVLSGVRNTGKVLAVLLDAGDEPDLDLLRAALLEKAPPGHLRDLLLRWIELGLRGELHGSDALLDNAWDRRSMIDNRSVSVHISLNRTSLKVGFLGTLYGLILTFPPMQRAVLGLADSEGEMKFIKDISAAIDGDEFAIMVTLGATALSILIELVTVQILERALGGFDIVNSHIDDWNLTRLQPWIRRTYGPEGQKIKLLTAQNDMDRKLAQVQAEMDKNLSHTLEVMAKTTKQIEMLSQVQAVVGKRVSELAEFEKQYRSFLQTKQATVAPPSHLRTPLGGARGETPSENGG